MRIALLSGLLAIILVAAARAGELTPADSSTPLFRVFAPVPIKTPIGASRESVTFDEKHPLLVVRSLSDLRVAGDKKSVLITLTPADATKFADITRKYNDRLLLLEAGGKILEAMHITAPIVDGIIGFKHPEQGPVAEYLRRRFRIAEFR